MKVGIIGCGASGMMAAITAARKGHNVTIIEHGTKAGKKLLATGNGKCNFTNAYISADNYNTNAKSLFEAVYSSFDNTATIKFFEEIGIYPYEKNGYYYPRSEQAVSVLDCLLYEIERLNICISYECNIKKIIKNNSFTVITDKGDYCFERLILAMGSKASEKTGSDGSGYQMAEALGHTVIAPLPALCGLKCEGKYFKSISGVRCKAMVSAFADTEFIKSDIGELQITDYGISGIPVFQISAEVNKALYSGKKVTVDLDFFTEASDIKETYLYLKKRANIMPDKTSESFLNGLFNKKLIKLFMEQSNIGIDEKCNALSEKQLMILSENINCFTVKVREANYDNAQIYSGGVCCDELKCTLESKIVDGLYFAGEIIDINGDCGGYNLQWAWSSGYVAGCLK